MHVLLIFVDGIGIGAHDPDRNPFSVANMPTLTSLTHGERWVQPIGAHYSANAAFKPIDPRMGVSGRPQSGTGHASIITGKNIPQQIGEHYGPKPNAATRQIVDEGSLFSAVIQHGKPAALLTAYPPHLLHDIARGKTLPTPFQQAAMRAGLSLMTAADLEAGRAISGDWTGHGWHEHLGFPDMPLISAYQAGQRLAYLAPQYAFSVVVHIFTDIVGHRGTLADGIAQLETLDAVFAGLLQHWDETDGTILLVSDHGNMEHLGDRHHTENDVPFLVVGRHATELVRQVNTLADIVPALQTLLLG